MLPVGTCKFINSKNIITCSADCLSQLSCQSSIFNHQSSIFTGIACSCFIRLADNLTRSDSARSLNKRFNATAQKARKCRFRDEMLFRLRFPSEHANSLTAKTSSHAQRVVSHNSLANHQSSIINHQSISQAPPKRHISRIQ